MLLLRCFTPKALCPVQQQQHRALPGSGQGLQEHARRAKLIPQPSFPGSPVPTFLPQDRDLCFRHRPSPCLVYCTLACCSSPSSQITGVGCVLPNAAGEHRGLVGLQIPSLLLSWDGRRSEGSEEEENSCVRKGGLAIALACCPGEKHLIKSRCSIQGCYSLAILLACLVLLNLL